MVSHLLAQDHASLVVQLEHSRERRAPGARLLHQDFVTLVEGRDQDSLVDVTGAVDDSGIHEKFFTGLVAKSGDEESVRVVGINDAVVLF